MAQAPPEETMNLITPEEEAKDLLYIQAVTCRNCGKAGHWTLKCPHEVEIKPRSGPPFEEKVLLSTTTEIKAEPTSIDFDFQKSLIKIKEHIAKQDMMNTDIHILEISDIPDADMTDNQPRKDTLSHARLAKLATMDYDGITIYDNETKKWTLSVMFKGAGLGSNGSGPAIIHINCRA